MQKLYLQGRGPGQVVAGKNSSVTSPSRRSPRSDSRTHGSAVFGLTTERAAFQERGVSCGTISKSPGRTLSPCLPVSNQPV